MAGLGRGRKEEKERKWGENNLIGSGKTGIFIVCDLE